MIPRHPLFLAALLILLLFPFAAAAQSEAPYAPKVVAPSDLLLTDRFQSSPVSFPWRLIAADRVSREGRFDFELLYDIEFSEVRETLREAYSNAEEVAQLNPGALRFTQVEDLRIAGMELGERRARLTLGHPDMEPVFRVELQADGPRTRVIVANSTVTRQFSGFVPARAGFRPAGAAPIPFRWN